MPRSTSQPTRVQRRGGRIGTDFQSKRSVTCLDVVCYYLSMKQKRAYQYRFYPTSEQEDLLARTFGCARYVYNWALRLRTDAYYKDQAAHRLS